MSQKSTGLSRNNQGNYEVRRQPQTTGQGFLDLPARGCLPGKHGVGIGDIPGHLELERKAQKQDHRDKAGLRSELGEDSKLHVRAVLRGRQQLHSADKQDDSERPNQDYEVQEQSEVRELLCRLRWLFDCAKGDQNHLQSDQPPQGSQLAARTVEAGRHYGQQRQDLRNASSTEFFVFLYLRFIKNHHSNASKFF